MKLKIILTFIWVSTLLQYTKADPIHDAVNRNDLAKVKELIENDKSLVSARNERQETALSLAVNKGNMDIVVYLVGNGADVHVRNASSNTPLYIAARKGRIEMVKYFIEKGAVVNARCEEGNTTLHAAVSANKPEIVEYLLTHGANANAFDDRGEPPLIKGCWSRAGVEVFNHLLNFGADIHFKSSTNRNCINDLAWNGKPEVVQFLVSKGADVNLAETGDGTNPLINATIYGRENFIDCILPSISDVNFRDKYNKRTALHWATLKGNKSIVEKLLNAGADGNLPDINNKTAAEYAVRYGYKDIASLFISKGILTAETLKNIPSSPMSGKVGQKQAVILYNGHSGWTVKTKNHTLIFDYCEERNNSSYAGILNGRISPEDLKGQKVYVFSSHDHGDHFDTASIFKWDKTIDKIKYIYGFDPSKSNIFRKKAYQGPAYTFIQPQNQQTVDDLKITTFTSNDTGEGFLVEVDGLSIFHAGDHANVNIDGQEAYQKEIDFVAGKINNIDVAFLPVTGCPVRWSPDVIMNGFFYVVDKLNPQLVFPMHGSDREYVYKNYQTKAQERGYKNKIECAENKGDVFRYVSK